MKGLFILRRFISQQSINVILVYLASAAVQEVFQHDDTTEEPMIIKT
jgi:hypothetical protein